jgi:hypothetical protein
MKKYIVFLVVLLAFGWWIWERNSEIEPDVNVTKGSRNVEFVNHSSNLQSDKRLSSQNQQSFDKTKKWIQDQDAGLIITQNFVPGTNFFRGNVKINDKFLNLGEDPPHYIHQLKTIGCPLMLGEEHERRNFRICAVSIYSEGNVYTKETALSVIYPRWTPTTGLKTSGGFVFMKEENPVHNIGVIVPEVVPEEGESLDMFDWQIQIRMNDRANDVDLLSYAKPLYLDSSVIVLLATHPDNIPKESKVVWFKIEKNGTVSLIK